MSEIAWPIGDDFPQDLLIDDVYMPNDNVIADEMESGPVLLRQRDTVIFGTWQCSLLLTKAHRATFLAFYQNDTKGGSLPFLWKDSITEEDKRFRFRGAPQLTTHGGGWYRAAFTLEEVPQ